MKKPPGHASAGRQATVSAHCSRAIGGETALPWSPASPRSFQRFMEMLELYNNLI